MNADTKYSYQKRISELERENRELASKLYDYRQTVLEIFDMIASLKNGNYFDPQAYLKKIRRCLK